MEGGGGEREEEEEGSLHTSNLIDVLSLANA